ncbi:MAG: hypothetical protein NTW21_38275 [Verrucomicrobia bacterium]|nr:hypothetical protein [Verrucomicrobiota bacterium]
MKPSPFKKWKRPDCLIKFEVPETDFLDWLVSKARAHAMRDLARGRDVAVPQYKQAIIVAVMESKGYDFYTGEILDWALIRKWNNEEAKRGGGEYRKRFWNLPTVVRDHDQAGLPVFRLCSWRMNDAKNDQTLHEFLDLAAKVKKHRGKMLR